MHDSAQGDVAEAVSGQDVYANFCGRNRENLHSAAVPCLRGSGTRSARIGVRVLAAIGFGPRGEALTQARGARVLAGDPLLLVRIAREVVHLVAARSEIDDVLPV